MSLSDNVRKAMKHTGLSLAVLAASSCGQNPAEEDFQNTIVAFAVHNLQAYVENPHGVVDKKEYFEIHRVPFFRIEFGNKKASLIYLLDDSKFQPANPSVGDTITVGSDGYITEIRQFVPKGESGLIWS